MEIKTFLGKKIKVEILRAKKKKKCLPFNLTKQNPSVLTAFTFSSLFFQRYIPALCIYLQWKMLN